MSSMWATRLQPAIKLDGESSPHGDQSDQHPGRRRQMPLQHTTLPRLGVAVQQAQCGIGMLSRDLVRSLGPVTGELGTDLLSVVLRSLRQQRDYSGPEMVIEP